MARRRKRNEGSDATPRPAAKPLTEAVIRQVGDWSAEAAEAYGLALFDVEIHPNWLIQIFVDRPGAPEPGKGVTVDECAEVSRYVEGFLDVDPTVWPNYTLEVSSPGIERKLTKPRHFEMSVGRDVRIVVHRPIDKRNVFLGRLAAFDGEVARVECTDGEVVPIEWGNIAKARLNFDFSE